MLRPDDTFKVYPDGEGEGKPVLIYRAQSAAYWIDYERRYNALRNDRPQDFYAQVAALAEDGLVGRENIDATAPLAKLVTIADIETIVMRKPVAAMLSDWDKKKLESQQPLSMDNSVANADAVSV